MKYALRAVVKTEVFCKIISVNVVGKLQRHQIFPFISIVHAVNDQNVVDAQLIKPPNDRTTNKPRPACNYNFHLLIT